MIHQGNLKTAFFDVKNRVLGLPQWNDRSKDVLDMLIGHEVGHALYTPIDAIERFNKACPGAPFDICNVVEDIRIERLVKAAYPGLPRLFKNAYQELSDENFFSIEGKDITQLNMIDRLNLRGKIGEVTHIELSDDEEVIFNKCADAETFEDVLEICKEIVETKKEEQDDTESEESEEEKSEESEEEVTEETTDEGVEEQDDSEDDGEEAEEAEEQDDSKVDSSASSDDVSGDSEESETTSTEVDSNSEPSKETHDDLISETQKSFDENLEKEAEQSIDHQVKPVMMPRKEYVYQQIIDYSTLKESRPDILKKFSESEITENLPNMFKEWLPIHKKDTTKKVNILVREFERRKAAYSYSRAQTSKTGVIDTNKLHSYKIAEDIFLSKTVLANSKSHGMVFLIDYSASMRSVLADVIEQTLNLVEFCMKVGIPFEVYSFTDSWLGNNYKGGDLTPFQDEVNLDNLIVINQMNSEMKKNELQEAIDYLWLRHWMMKNHDLANPHAEHYNSKYEALSGTPLNNVLAMMHQVVRDFVAKHGVQKTHFVTLTDGDSSRMHIGNKSRHETACSKGTFKANNKTYKNSLFGHGTPEMLGMIGDIPTVKTVGFFIPEQYSVKSKLRNVVGYIESSKFNNIYKKWKKEGFVEFTDKNGYDSFFLLGCDLAVEDEEFEYDSGDDIVSSRAAQSKLAKAFSKNKSSNKKTRVLMTKIAEKVA